MRTPVLPSDVEKAQARLLEALGLENSPNLTPGARLYWRSLVKAAPMAPRVAALLAEWGVSHRALSSRFERRGMRVRTHLFLIRLTLWRLLVERPDTSLASAFLAIGYEWGHSGTRTVARTFGSTGRQLVRERDVPYFVGLVREQVASWPAGFDPFPAEGERQCQSLKAQRVAERTVGLYRVVVSVELRVEADSESGAKINAEAAVWRGLRVAGLVQARKVEVVEGPTKFAEGKTL